MSREHHSLLQSSLMRTFALLSVGLVLSLVAVICRRRRPRRPALADSAVGDLRGLRDVSAVSQGHLRPVEQARMANVVRIRACPPTRSFPICRSPIRSSLSRRRHRVRVRQQVEAAVFHQGRRRLFSVAGAVGRHEQESGGRISCSRRRIGGCRFIRRTTMKRPDRADVRRVPFRRTTTFTTKTVTEWNVGCEKCHGPGADHVKASLASEYRESGAPRLRRANDIVHPVPFAGTAADESDRGASTTTGRWVSTWGCDCKISGSSRSTSSERRRLPISPMARHTRTACRATTSCRASCTGAA